jgi:nuclear pore complex protein Nup98-Nup96
LFGNKPATTTFGTTQSESLILSHDSPLISIHDIANSNGAFDSVAPVTTGTAGTPFSPFGEKDTANSNITLQYQSITSMPAYRGSSYEVR